MTTTCSAVAATAMQTIFSGFGESRFDRVVDDDDEYDDDDDDDDDSYTFTNGTLVAPEIGIFSLIKILLEFSSGCCSQKM